MIHRDIRPGNLLLDGAGGTYLGDFGIALPFDDSDAVLTGPTHTHHRHDRNGVATDVLGLGTTAYQVLTGQAPLSVGGSDVDSMASVTSVRPELPAAVDDVLARARAASPSDRYPTAAEFVSDMVAALETDRRVRSVVPLLEAEARNPYVGLHAFDEAESDFFFGRDRLVADVLAAIEQLPFVAVVGASGIGKSSVVRAGVVPAIRQGRIAGSEAWFVTTMVPGRSPIDALETALLRIAVNPPPSLRTQLQEDGGLLRAIRRVMPSDRDRILLVVDQFEELFTQSVDADRVRFLDELTAAITAPDSPLRVVASLRADRYDEPLRHAGMAELMAEGTIVVPPMTPAELEEVIVLPARRVGADVESVLVAELIATVAEQPASLPLLQFSLTELYERRVSGLMLRSTHDEIGGLTGALASRADRIVDGAGPTGDEVARTVFGRLVTLGDGVGDARRRALRTEFGDDPAVSTMIDEFVAARLLTTDRDPATREPTVEVAHEALLRDWPRLRSWLSDDRVDLRTLHSINAAAERWSASDRDSGDLGRGARLEAANDFAARRPHQLTALETGWVRESAEAAQRARRESAAVAERDRRQNRRLRGLLTVAATLLAIAVFAAVVALVLRSRSVDSERRAEAASAVSASNAAAALEAEEAAVASETAAEQARLEAESAQAQAETNERRARVAADTAAAAQADAEIERLIALSAAEGVDEPDRGILLALEAHRQRPDLSTTTAVHRALTIDSRIVRIRSDAGSGLDRAMLDGDGGVALLWSESENGSSVRFTDPVRGREISEVTDLDMGVFRAELSDDGSVAALIDGDVATFMTVEDGAVTATVDAAGGFLVDVSRDGRLVAVHLDERAAVFNSATGEEVFTHPVPDGLETAGVALAPDGSVLAVMANSGFEDEPETVLIDLLLVETGELLRRIEAPSSFAWDMEMTYDGRLAVASADGVVRLYVIDGAEEDIELRAFREDVLRVATNRNGDVVAASEEGAIRIWSADGAPLDAPFPWSGLISDLAISDDRLVTVTTDNRPMITFGIGAQSVLVDRIPTEGAVTVGHSRGYFDEILTGGGIVRLRTLGTGETIAELDVRDRWPSGAVGRSFFSANGEWVLSFSADFSGVAVWNSDGSVRHFLELNDLYEAAGFPNFVGEIALRPGNDGERLFFPAQLSDEGDYAAVWLSIPDLKVMSGPQPLPAIGSPLELENGDVFMSGFFDQILLLSDDLASEPSVIEGSATLRPFDRNDANGDIAMGGVEGEVALYLAATSEIRPLGDVTGFVNDIAFSPDHSMVAVATLEGALSIIDVETGQTVGSSIVVQALGSRADAGVRWADDGRSVWFSAGGDPTRVLADPDGWVERACSIIDRELSVEEWRRFVSETTEPVAACPNEA